MNGCEERGTQARPLLASRLAYHLRCLREDATDPAMSSLERLALVRDRARRIRENSKGTRDPNERGLPPWPRFGVQVKAIGE
jgi:hypothetical protein